MNNFYKGKRVFVTGHTGFKGSWLCSVLLKMGAKVAGYALTSNTEPSLYNLIDLESKMESTIADIRDLELLKQAINNFKPEIVLHLAAQPIVRESYSNPVYTYETNVMGTVNILEAVRNCESVKSFVNVTTDKVYKNNEWCYGYRETDVLDGYDPYSNSKSCSELVTASYKRSFLDGKVAVSTARAGNVIGGGDFAKDRIVPDCVRYTINEQPIMIRNPYSIRPYQHVLEPVVAYLKIAQAQYEDQELQGNYNIGPDISDCITTEELVNLFCEIWGEDSRYEVAQVENNKMHEANFLKLDNSKLRNTLGIRPRWNIKKAIEKTVEFEKAIVNNKNLYDMLEKQISEYLIGEEQD